MLFVGPFDLSIGLGIRGQFDHPRFAAALEAVVAGARAAGKAAGILLQHTDQVAATVERGFTFVAIGSDAGLVANGMAELAAAFTPYRMHLEEE